MKYYTLKHLILSVLFVLPLLTCAQVMLESEVKITDLAMYFNGVKNQNSTNSDRTTAYDYAYGKSLTPHGDCIKTYKQYVFMSWYRGGKNDRHVMLSRYNTETGSIKTIEFPHQHTGFNGKWWIGETHNTIAIGISPLNGTVHMVYDMHAYTNNGLFANDYFRYSYSVDNAADLPDNEFALNKFVKDPLDGDYKHTTMDGVRNASRYDRFTYPQFFLNDEGELFLTARDGTSHDGAQAFIRYEANANKWGRFKYLNALGAKAKGETHNWSIYGSIKYVNGKIRAGFQRRLNNGSDKFQFQNGVYYAYSDNPTGASDWKSHKGEAMTLPLVKAEEVLVYEPGDFVETTARNQVHIVGGFDWTVTVNGDVHIISKVTDKESNVVKNLHSYKPNGASEFIISPDFRGAEALYTSGNNVYIIGLNATGRPFVERAEGGTNQFTKVYEQTSGKRFRKGEVYIADGKLYYYLLENYPADTGATQPSYLQIIDLDIVEAPTTLGVNLVTPMANQTFNEGENIELLATASADEGNNITKVEFVVNDNVINEDTTSPYTLDWIPDNFGTYRIKAVAYQNGGASITSSEITVIVKEVDESDLTLDKYRLQNMASGKFITDSGVSAVPVTMSDSGDETNTHFSFVKSGTFYNIDSETFGSLRATGAGFDDGNKPFFVVSTGRDAPTSDTDKIWNVYHNESDNTYRFEAGDNNRFLYHTVNGDLTNIEASETDTRSKWKLISNRTLGVADNNVLSSGIKVYPNPVEDRFVITFNGFTNAKVIISSMLGKVVYKTNTKEQRVEVSKADGFSSGLYVIQVISENGNLTNKKLVIK